MLQETDFLAHSSQNLSEEILEMGASFISQRHEALSFQGSNLRLAA